MGMIEDIVNLMRKGPQLSSELDAVKINTKSVARGANDATLQFPCIVTETIPSDMAITVSRVMERVYASFTQSWLSLHPVIDISIDKNPIQFLKKFHQNVKWESVETRMLEDNEIVDLFESVLKKDYKLYMSHDNTYGIFFNTADKPTAAMLESFTNGMREYLSDFDTRFMKEAPDDGQEDLTFSQAVVNGIQAQAERDRKTAENDSKYKTSGGTYAPKLQERDIKKTNDMLPYAMEVRLMAVNEKNEFVQWINFVVGVKTVLHLVKSDDMIGNIIMVLKNRSMFNKILRWTSGEISLWKNIILDLDSLKYDAVAKADKRSPFFRTLKKLKEKKLGLHNGTVPHGIIPNSTIVVTEYEVDQIRKLSGMDIHDVKIAKSILNKLFLMTFIVVDNANGLVDILYDGATAFQTYTLESLEREVSLNSNKLGKEIGRMISSQ